MLHLHSYFNLIVIFRFNRHILDTKVQFVKKKSTICKSDRNWRHSHSAESILSAFIIRTLFRFLMNKLSNIFFRSFLLIAKTCVLRNAASELSIVRSNHRIIDRKIPTFPILVRSHIISCF